MCRQKRMLVVVEQFAYWTDKWESAYWKDYTKTNVWLSKQRKWRIFLEWTTTCRLNAMKVKHIFFLFFSVFHLISHSSVHSSIESFLRRIKLLSLIMTYETWKIIFFLNDKAYLQSVAHFLLLATKLSSFLILCFVDTLVELSIFS